MKKKLCIFLLLPVLITGTLLFSCSRRTAPGSGTAVSTTGPVRIASPSCIVYKTRSDYSRNVPVMLSDDRNSIVSYPDIKDIYFDGKLSYPVKLVDGYLLDNRGIGLDVAFLSYTYEEYSRLASTPPAAELWNHVLDKDPLLEMYRCGKRSDYPEPEQELNAIISSGRLSGYERLK